MQTKGRAPKRMVVFMAKMWYGTAHGFDSGCTACLSLVSAFLSFLGHILTCKRQCARHNLCYERSELQPALREEIMQTLFEACTLRLVNGGSAAG